MLGGRIDMYFGTLATLLPRVREGKLRAIAITSGARSLELPDVPTMAEAIHRPQDRVAMDQRRIR